MVKSADEIPGREDKARREDRISGLSARRGPRSSVDGYDGQDDRRVSSVSRHELAGATSPISGPGGARAEPARHGDRLRRQSCGPRHDLRCSAGGNIHGPNVANLVPPYAPDGSQHATSAALEFGVRLLRVTDLVVLGHAMCGGVRALLTGAPQEARDFLAPWISVARAARGKVLRCADPDEAQERCEQEVVKLSLDNLMTFPWIAEPVRVGTLRLHGMRFDIRSGALAALGADGLFHPI
jgi:carbonic anhydrase